MLFNNEIYINKNFCGHFTYTQEPVLSVAKKYIFSTQNQGLLKLRCRLTAFARWWCKYLFGPKRDLNCHNPSVPPSIHSLQTCQKISVFLEQSTQSTVAQSEPKIVHLVMFKVFVFVLRIYWTNSMASVILVLVSWKSILNSTLPLPLFVVGSVSVLL